jgi:hypothetical protein
MNPIELATLETVLLTMMGAGTFLMTVILVTRAWGKRGTALSSRDAAQLLEGVDTLTHAIEDLRTEVSEISDRLEFTERLLTRVAESTRAGGQLPGDA